MTNRNASVFRTASVAHRSDCRDIRYAGLTAAQWVAAVVMAALPFVALRRRTLAFAITGVVILAAGWACVGGSR